MPFFTARSLQEKVIVITGASSGIGAATATACARAGMRVVLAGRRAALLAEQVARIEAEVGTGRALAVGCDVIREAQVRALFEQTRHAFGRIDAVLANAGYGLERPVLQTGEAEHRAIFECNYFGTVRTLQLAWPHLKAAPEGLRHLLVTSSILSEIAPATLGAYAATKAAQDALACALRVELRQAGGQVTSIHPATTRTEFFEQADRRSGGDGQVHLPWMAQSPEHVAGRIVAVLRRPRPEVWPLPGGRWAVALATAFPRLSLKFLTRGVGGYRPPAEVD